MHTQSDMGEWEGGWGGKVGFQNPWTNPTSPQVQPRHIYIYLQIIVLCMQIVLAARTQFYCTCPPQCRKGREWVWLEGYFVQLDREYRGPAAGHNLHELVNVGDQICVLKVVHVRQLHTSCELHSAARHFRVL